MAQDMEEQVSAHAEELQSKNEMLAKQKELATKYSAKLTELEKERRLNLLTLKDLQKQLATEKTVSTKFYDEVRATIVYLLYSSQITILRSQACR